MSGLPKAPAAFRLTDDAQQMLADLARRLGISKTAAIELAIREQAQKQAYIAWYEGAPRSKAGKRKYVPP